MNSRRVRAIYDLRGVVQGVGFRPTVYRLARADGLDGWVQNRTGVVRILLEGPAQDVDRFIADLPHRLPPEARIDTCDLVERGPLPAQAETNGFRILASADGENMAVLIPPDLAVCPDCLTDLYDPSNRRYGYAFTTCTRCGPRYTVLTAMPYDRERTTMTPFPMCAECRHEYTDPADRRFHAETIACPTCGPRLQFCDNSGTPLPGDPLRAARRALADGAIVAVRGIGGFLLATDALQRETLTRLRTRKNRPHKPLALMAADLSTLERYCRVPEEAATLLLSPQAPIVILDTLPEAAASGRFPLDLVTPDAHTVGAMLPTSPLHALLARPLPGDETPPFDLLVMTSGNRRGEPICLTNEEALHRLHGIADFFLLHDREIRLRNDDSVCTLQRGQPQTWRRARGYAPEAVRMPGLLQRTVLAMGAELKNAIAVGFEDRAVLSPHIGDLDTPESVEGLRTVCETLPAFLEQVPEVVAVDLHPDMQSTRIGRELAASLGVPVRDVQHHHAHALACLAENGRTEGLALVFDGTGLGPDGTVWGAELLAVEPGAYQRLAAFVAAPLPGGDAAVRHPARQAVARLWKAGLPPTEDLRNVLQVTQEEWAIWTQQCERQLHCPLSHGAGRLFDSIAALLGLARGMTTYDGQAAIRLEAAARRHGDRPAPELPFSMSRTDDVLWIDWTAAITKLADAAAARHGPEAMAMAAHRAIARAAVSMVQYGIERTGRNEVALSGGVFMNRVLNELIAPPLQKQDLRVLVHRQTPPNDGGIALGQVLAAGAGRCV